MLNGIWSHEQGADGETAAASFWSGQKIYRRDNAASWLRLALVSSPSQGPTLYANGTRVMQLTRAQAERPCSSPDTRSFYPRHCLNISLEGGLSVTNLRNGVHKKRRSDEQCGLNHMEDAQIYRHKVIYGSVARACMVAPNERGSLIVDEEERAGIILRVSTLAIFSKSMKPDEVKLKLFTNGFWTPLESRPHFFEWQNAAMVVPIAIFYATIAIAIPVGLWARSLGKEKRLQQSQSWRHHLEVRQLQLISTL